MPVEIISLLISEPFKIFCITLTTKQRDKALCFYTPHLSYSHQPHQSGCSLNILDMFLPRFLPLLFPLVTVFSPKICIDVLYYFIQISVQMTYTERELSGPSYMNSNSLPPICCLSTMLLFSTL